MHKKGCVNGKDIIYGKGYLTKRKFVNGQDIDLTGRIFNNGKKIIYRKVSY